MRAQFFVLAVAACSFQHGSVVPTPSDAPTDPATPDGIGHTAAVCNNGQLEAGEACEVGSVRMCTTSCGDIGTQACTSSCTLDTCDVVVAPTSGWEVSSNGSMW